MDHIFIDTPVFSTVASRIEHGYGVDRVGSIIECQTTSLLRRKSYPLRCFKRIRAPAVSISTTRETPMASGFSHGAILLFVRWTPRNYRSLPPPVGQKKHCLRGLLRCNRWGC